MSYRVKSYAIDGTGEKNGIVPGIYEECGTFAKENVITVSRGKMIIAGFEITVDGREVLTVPYDWKSGEYYLVGSLAVKDERAESFVMSIRDNKNLRRDSVCGEGFGIYEELIAKIFKRNNDIGVSRELPVLLGNTEEYDCPVYLPKKKVKGQFVTIENAQDGKMYNVALCGNCNNRGSGNIDRVPSEFKMFSGTGNMFDEKKCDVVYKESDKKGKYVYAEKVSLAERIDDGYHFVSWREEGSEYNSNGWAEFFIGKTGTGYHTFSFDCTCSDYWTEGNPNNEMTLRIVQDGLTVYTEVLSLNNGGVNEISSCFELKNEGVVVVRLFFNGLDIKLKKIQFENDLMKTTYSYYGRREDNIVIADKFGNKYELMSTQSVRDKVYKKNGKYVLLKKTALSYVTVNDARKYTKYWLSTERTAQVADNSGTIVVPEGAYIIYEPQEYVEIELDENGLVGLDNVRTYFGRTEIKFDSLVNPYFEGEYVENVEYRIKLLDGYVENLLKNFS